MYPRFFCFVLFFASPLQHSYLTNRNKHDYDHHGNLVVLLKLYTVSHDCI